MSEKGIRRKSDKEADMAEQFYRANVLVCGGTGCAASESLDVIQALNKEVARAVWRKRCVWSKQDAVDSVPWDL